jgi:ParB family chromosome partitioning protein
MGTDVTDLEKSISTVGLIAPLVISTDNIILAGARRYQALLNLGYTEAAVVIIDKGELEKELISIDENLVRKDLSKVEIEGHLRRAKEIYEALNPNEEVAVVEEVMEGGKKARKEILPSEKFLNIVAEKTGLSPKQIHEAINRDSLASSQVKAARQKGELSISQTNEIVKLNAEDQRKSLGHLMTLPVKEIKKFVKTAKANGVDFAIKGISNLPHAREFNEIENILKRLQKKLKQLEIEGIDLSHFPGSTREVFEEVASFSDRSSLGSNHHGRNEVEADSAH